MYDNDLTGLWYPGSIVETAGIQCVGSSPNIVGNEIESFANGLHVIEGGSPVLQTGFNVIINNNSGVKSENSEPILGNSDVGEGGMNSIYGSEEYEVVLVNEEKTTVYAQNNWWGTTEVDPGQFSVDENSGLKYEPWLYEDPNLGNRPFAGIGTPIDEHTTLSSSDSEHGEEDPRLTPTPTIMRQALALRLRGRYDEAMVLLRTIIADPLLPSYVRNWAVGQLLPVAVHVSNPNLSMYLRTVGQAYPELRRKVRAVLPRSYLFERSGQNAIAAYDSNIQRYPNSSLHCEGLYGKFVLALYTDGDTTQARTLYTALVSTFPSSAERYLAEVQLANYHTGTGATIQGMQSISGTNSTTENSVGSRLPEKFDLSQNYPNPFNPSTVIRYQIPEASYVSLRIYDVLGREVATLVDEAKDAGYYEAVFDASSLSSGMYFYRMQAGEFVSVKKLMVLK